MADYNISGPFPVASPFGNIGRAGAPLAYLIDPGAGSGSDRVTRFWPSREVLDDITRRGGSITPLYAKPTPDTVSYAEHWSIEQVKRVVISAMVEYTSGAAKPEKPGMAVIARRAADKLLALLVPNEPHRPMVEERTDQ